MRFLRIEPDCRPSFDAWLDALEAQLQFRESSRSPPSRFEKTCGCVPPRCGTIDPGYPP
jgi:hypothetical protein